MKEYALDFCNLIHHDNGILEIIVDEGVEITGDMAHQFLDRIAAIKEIENRYGRTLAKLVDEYNYIKHTRLIK